METTPDLESIAQLPAPWQLRGNGYILAYRFPPDFVQEQGFLPPALAGSFAGGVGAVMLVDYQRSDAGPYRELLFMPGQFRLDGRQFFSITKIYVSTWQSVINGRRNWGIPKELAHFEAQQLDEKRECVRVMQNGRVFAELLLETQGPHLPFSTAFVPRRLRTLAELWQGKTYLTAPGGRGRVQAARLIQARIERNYFPDFSALRPLASLRASGFDLEFPQAQFYTRSDAHAN